MFFKKSKIIFLIFILIFILSVNSLWAQKGANILIFASSGEEGDNLPNQTFLKLIDLIEEKTKGYFQVNYRPSMQLGDEPETVRLCQSGSIQMATLLSSNLAPFAAEINWMSMPYFFETREDFHKAVLAMLNRTNEWIVPKAGVRVIAINEMGFRNLTMNAKSKAQTLAEVKKLRIRVPASNMNLTIYDSLGLKPVALNFAETFGALAQGVVDGQESAYSLVALKKFYEVQKYALDIETSLHVGIVIASEKWLNSLEPELKADIIEAGRLASLYNFQLGTEYVDKDIALMKKEGMIMLGKPTDMEIWREKGRKSWPKAYEIIGDGDSKRGKDIVDEVKKTF